MCVLLLCKPIFLVYFFYPPPSCSRCRCHAQLFQNKKRAAVFISIGFQLVWQHPISFYYYHQHQVERTRGALPDCHHRQHLQLGVFQSSQTTLRVFVNWPWWSHIRAPSLASRNNAALLFFLFIYFYFYRFIWQNSPSGICITPCCILQAKRALRAADYTAGLYRNTRCRGIDSGMHKHTPLHTPVVAPFQRFRCLHTLLALERGFARWFSLLVVVITGLWCSRSCVGFTK